MPDSGDHAESFRVDCVQNILDVATERLHSRPRSMIENLALRLRSTGFAMLAYRHAESCQGTHREIARGNSANQ